GNDATNKTYVDTAITAAAADGSETIVTGGTDISVTGTGTTANPYIVNSTFTEVDGSITNEIQNSAQVNLSTPLDVDGDTVNETTVQEAIADLAASNSDDQTAAEVSFDDTASTLGATDVQGAIDALAASNAADGDTDATNEIQNINEVLADGNNAGGLVIDNIGAPIDGNDATNKNYVDTAITAAAADGSETIVTAGTDISVTGTGTTANPYIVNSTFTEVDGSITNEIQNSAQVNLSTPLDVDGDTVNETTVQEAIADLAASSSDDQNLTGATLTGTSLQIDIEGGTSTTVDLAGLQDGTGTDDQTAAEVSFDDTASTLGATDVQGAIDALAASNTADNDTDATNEIQTLSKTGTTISLSNGGGSVNETVTTLTQNDVSPTGEITYTNEAGTATTAQVVSANAGNQVTVGTDGGAFFASPVKAIGKVLGTGVAAKIRNATVTRLDEGDYQITFTSAMPDAHYIIQLSILDCGGDCPGNSTSNYDDPGISYYAQTTTGFRVNIGDSDNGTNQKDDIDLEFMFTVLDY
ncbi:beta strand repeat-containing protein, partial [Aquimarina intermedia]